MAKTIETLVYEFLEAAKAASQGTLRQAEIHDTVYQSFPESVQLAVRVGDAASDFVASYEGETTIKEADALLILVVAARVNGKEKKDRLAARDAAFTLAQEVFAAIDDDRSLGGRVCQTEVLRVPRGYDSLNSVPYAVFHLPLLINPTGAAIGFGGVENGV